MRSLIVVLLSVFCGFTPVASAVYDPGQGRWLYRDPVGYLDGMQLYRYGGSSPIKYLDPLGTKIEIRTPNQRREDIEKNRRAVEEAMQKLCPDARLNRPNKNHPEFPGDRVEIGSCDKDNKKEDDPCSNPPGCRILRRLIDSPTTYTITVAPGLNPAMTVPRTGPARIHWPPTPLSPDGLDREYAPWEILWHELLHLLHYDHQFWSYGLPPRNSGGATTFPLEELLTIEEMNELREWYNQCSGTEQPVPPRDPFTHPHLRPFGPGDFESRPLLPADYQPVRTP